MGKIGTFVSSFKTNMKNNESSNQDFRNNADDYNTVSKSKGFYVASAVFSLIAAVLIWLVAITTGKGVSEKPFALNIDMNDYGAFVSAAEQSGFNVVIAESDKTVSFTVEGRKKSIDKLSAENIIVHVNFEEYVGLVNTLPNDTEQTITAQIVIDVPVYFSVSDVSKREITIRLVPINKTLG